MDGYGYKLNELPSKEKPTASNYEAWSLAMGPCLFSTGCRPLIFGVRGGLPVPRRVNFYTQGIRACLDTKKDVENWDKSDEAGYQTILLNICPDYCFIIQQNRGVT